MFKAACCRLIFVDITKHHSYVCIYKCIGDDTKGAARQSLNCIKHKKKIKYGEKRFSIYPAMWHVALESWQWIHQEVAAPCNVIRGSGMTCRRIRPNVLAWNSTSGFDLDHITPVDMSFCTSLRNFIQIGPSWAEKMTSCRFSRWRIRAILDFRDPIMGSLKSPIT